MPSQGIATAPVHFLDGILARLQQDEFCSAPIAISPDSASDYLVPILSSRCLPVGRIR